VNNQENNPQQNTEQTEQKRPLGVAVRPPFKDSPLGNPDLRPVTSVKEAVFAAFALLVCFIGASLALAFENAAASSLCAAAVIVTGLIWTCKTGKKVNCILMALLPTGLWFFTGALSLAALYAGGICITVAVARLLSHKRGRLGVLCTAVAVLVSIVIVGTDNLVAVLFPLGYALAGITLALLSMTFAPRVGTVCAMTLTMLAALAAAGLLTVYALQGACTGDAILRAIGDVRDQCAAVLDEVLAEYAALAAAGGQDVSNVINHNTSVAAVNAVFNMTPALAVLFCMIPAFFTQIIFVVSCEAEENPVYKGVLLHRFALSPIAAMVFLLCEICALFAWSDNAYAAVIENMYLIMLPGLFLVGLFNLLAMFRPRTKSHTPTVIIILACCFMPAFVIPLLGFFGAYLIVRGYIAMLIASRRNRRDGT